MKINFKYTFGLVLLLSTAVAQAQENQQLPSHKEKPVLIDDTHPESLKLAKQKHDREAQNLVMNNGKFILGVSSMLSSVGTGSGIGLIGFTSSTQKSDAVGYTEQNPVKTTNINLLPKFGYFVVDNLAVGLDISLIYQSRSLKVINNESNSKGTYFCVGPFVRYYIPAGKILPYLEITGGYGAENSWSRDTYSSYSYIRTSSSGLFSVGGGAGIAIPIGDKVTFDALLGYNSLTVYDPVNNTDNQRTVTGTFGLKLGFSVLLGSK
ncbi:MAG TPA: hypothetical protein VI413_13680, partial [Paludibacter sp.]